MLRNTNKFLKYFGWLALINPLVLVKAEDFAQCSSINGFNSSSCGNDASRAASYCIKSNKIYGLDASNPPACLGQISAGIYVFQKEASSTTTTIADSDLENTVIYNCDSSSCSQTYGYIKRGLDYYKIAKGGGNAKITSSLGTCTSETNIGNLITDGKLCINGVTTDAISLASAGEKKVYLMKNIASNIFTNAASADASKYIVIIATENSFTLSSISPLTISSGNHVFDTDTFTEINLTTANSVTTTNLAKLAMYNCDGVCKLIYGYIINSSKYYKIASDGNAEVTDTTYSNVGNLLTTGELCLDTTGPITASTAGDYLATFSGANVFGPTSGSYLINISSTMITLGNAVNLITGTEKVYSTVAESSIAANADVSLYICGSDNACKSTFGYVKNSDYFSVGVSGSGKAASALASGATAIAIDSCTPGSLFIDSDGSKTKLCIAAGEGIELTSTSTVTNHIINNLSSNIFTSVAASSKAKIVLQISTNAVVLNTLYDEATGYCTYQGTNSEASLTKFCSTTVLDGKLFDCGEGLCSALTTNSVENGTYLVHIGEEDKIYKCASNSCDLETSISDVFVSQQKDASDTMVETRIDGTGLASLTSTDFAAPPTNPVYLYECDSGVCKRTSGFIKYGSTPAIAKCTSSASCADYTAVTCASASNEGEAALVDSKLTICDANGESQGYSADDYGYFVTSSLYIINSDSSIIYATTKSGNFLLDEKLIICTEGTCADQSSNKGYYTNTLGTTSKSLIKCDTKCEAVEAGNGYYLNQLVTTEVIVCDNSGCSEEDDESLNQTDCSSSAYKVVSISSAFKFCKGTTASAIPTDTTVTNYFIKKALTEGMNYPTSFMATADNNKRMLIQVSQFAVTSIATTPAGYYFVDADSTLASTGTGTLLSCTGASSPLTCEDLTTGSHANIGYYKNAGDLDTGAYPYIACTAANTCQPKAASRSCDGIGNIFSETDAEGNTTYSLCIDNDTNNPISVELTSSGSYFINVAGSGIVFGTKSSSYAIITIENENVFLKGKEGKERYRYGDANQKVIDFTNATDKSTNCKDSSGTLVLESTVAEYKLSAPADADPTDYYTK